MRLMVSMEVYEAEQAQSKGVKEEVARLPLGPSEKNIVGSRRRITREIPSRYKAAVTSHSVSTPVVARRSPSPNVARTVSTASFSTSKRAQSAERKRPSTPPSPPSPSKPVEDASAGLQNASRRLQGVRSEGLWPSSTMRSLYVSFQSDSFSLPIRKKEKPITDASSDHTLRTSANATHRQAEKPVVRRKATPERKRTPLRGSNASDQSENSRPVDNSSPQVIDQNRASARMGGKVSSSAVNSSIDLTDKANKASSLPRSGRGVSPLRRSAVPNGMSSGLQKSKSEVASRLLFDRGGRVESDLCTLNDVPLLASGTDNLSPSSVCVSSSSSDGTSSPIPRFRFQSLPLPGSSLPPSPSKAPFLSSSPSRGTLSPSRTRPTSPFPSVSSVTSWSSSTSSVLSFAADYRKGKKGANHIENAHQLRLLYNRYLQWRFVNAQADAVFSNKKITAERTLYNVWNATSALQSSVTSQRINTQQLTEKLKLKSILDKQMDYLDDWALLEGQQSSSLAEAIKALEACTLRVPCTAGSRADTITLKNAIYSAVGVMQELQSSVDPLLSRVEGTKSLVSQLADVTIKERAMLDEYVDLLASTAAMQVEENSLRTNIIQMKRAIRSEAAYISTVETFV